MGDYRKLDVWNRAHQLVLAVYRATASFPDREQDGLVSQMRRAAFSIPVNIAEGCGRNADSELCRSLRIALGSAAELEYQVLLSRDVGYLDAAAASMLEEELDHVKRMLARLSHRIAPQTTNRRAAGSNGGQRRHAATAGQRIADGGASRTST